MKKKYEFCELDVLSGLDYCVENLAFENEGREIFLNTLEEILRIRKASERDIKVFKMYYGINCDKKTIKQIKEELKLSQPRTYEILHLSRIKIKNYLKNNPDKKDLLNSYFYEF